MKLQELRYLLAVFDEGHFGRAAKACFVTQPTLSAGIRRLEEELDGKLFERGRHGARPTELARAVQPEAREILAAAERIRQTARHRQGPLEGRFQLGAIPTIAPYLLPHVVPSLHEAYDELELLLSEAQTRELVEALREGRLDAALLSPPVEDRTLESRPLYREPFLLATPLEHPLARRRRVRQEELLEEPLLLLDEGHCLRDQILTLCRTPSTPLREIFRAASLETLRAMVAAGIGCTLLPLLAVVGRPAGDVALVPFRRPVPSREVALYWRRGYAKPSWIEVLHAFLVDHLPAEVEAV